MHWRGEKMVLSRPSEARARGIGMVFQHFSLFDNLTVAENVALGLDGTESFKDVSARLEQVSRVYGLPLDPKRQVWQLSVGERQRIEIVRALMQDPKFLILDEPTAVLTPQEADQLFIVLDRLKAEGRAILYISHKLEEVKRLCDTATILRGGRKIATCNPQAETAASLARMMVGTEIKQVKAAAGRQTTVPRLVVNDLSLEPDDPHGVRLKHISLEVKGGEILGIAGVAGNGQDELIEAIVGLRKPSGGTVTLGGTDITGLKSRSVYEHGVGYVPADRHRFGLVLSFSIADNLVLTSYHRQPYARRLLRDEAAIHASAEERIKAYDIRTPSADAKASTLSGGNQQKVVIAREFSRDLRLLVLDQPTRGLDVGSIEFIHKQTIAKRDAGAAVLLVSAELDEILELSDRIAVIYRGRLVGLRDGRTADKNDVGLLMATGGRAGDDGTSKGETAKEETGEVA
jgi:simple sugar transport system ATP-binding protein